MANDFLERAQALYPWLPQNLVRTFADSWAETGDRALALAEMRQSKAYDDAFPGNRTEDGQVFMDEQSYASYTDSARRLMKQAGLPEGFYDSREDLGRLVSGRVTLSNLNDRIQQGITRARQAPIEIREELERVHGVGLGAQAAFALDPERGLEAIQRNYNEAAIRGRAAIAGYDSISIEESQRLADLGVDEQSAAEGFQELAGSEELFTGLTGTREQDIDQRTQLDAAFGGDAEASARIRRRQESRLAAFEGGGGAAASGEGVTGLRTAE